MLHARSYQQIYFLIKKILTCHIEPIALWASLSNYCIRWRWRPTEISVPSPITIWAWNEHQEECARHYYSNSFYIFHFHSDFSHRKWGCVRYSQSTNAFLRKNTDGNLWINHQQMILWMCQIEWMSLTAVRIQLKAMYLLSHLGWEPNPVWFFFPHHLSACVQKEADFISMTLFYMWHLHNSNN